MSEYAISRRTRDKLINAAGALAAKHGYRNMSMRAIAARAGENLGSIHYHFGGKKGLLLAMMQAILAPWIDNPIEATLAPLRRRLKTRAGQALALRACVHRHFEDLVLTNFPWWHMPVLFQVLQQRTPLRDLLIKHVMRPTERVMTEVLQHVRPGISREDILLTIHVMIAPIELHCNHSDVLLEQLGMKQYSSAYLAKLEEILTSNILRQ
ncbi:MAG: TetR/AcrR family transcriptional regulator, partial [bacterium]|nr:TetR/AcrR family transcriptional regulator [bacterium]